MPHKQPTWEVIRGDVNLCEYCEVGPYLCCVEQSLDEPYGWRYTIDETDLPHGQTGTLRSDYEYPDKSTAQGRVLAKVEQLKKAPPRFTRIEITRGPDSLNRYAYTLYWKADWMPGNGPKENWRGQKAQCFFDTLPLRRQVGKVVDKRTTKTRLTWQGRNTYRK